MLEQKENQRLNDPIYSAHSLKRFLQKQLENRLARGIMAGEITDDATLHFDILDGELDTEVENAK